MSNGSDGRLVRLVHIQIVQQAMPLRANVADLQYDLARNLLLHVEVVVLHIRSWKVTVNRENVPLGVPRRCCRIPARYWRWTPLFLRGNRRWAGGVVSNARTKVQLYGNSPRNAS